MAIDFDGTNDCIKTSGSNNNILRDASFTNKSYSFTVSCWVRPHGKQDSVIWSQYLTSGSGQGGRLALEMVDSDKKFKLRFSAGEDATDPDAYIDANTNWYHLVCTFAWADRYLYINGDVGSPAISNPGNRNSLHEKASLATLIGASLNVSSFFEENFFDGDIAEWAAWKVVLSAGEITSLYNGASPIMVRSDNLLAYFPLGGPYVDSSTPYRDMTNQKTLAASDSPTFIATPRAFSTSTGMFYPHTEPVAVVAAASEEEEEEKPSSTSSSEAALTGSDVIHEIITANDRKQGGICVHSGGTTFAKRDNNIQIAAQNQITEMNDRVVEKDRQDHRDEISTDTNNSDGWFGV